jgi:hypothetical protein
LAALRARTLGAPIFLGFLPRPTGRCASLPSNAASLLYFLSFREKIQDREKIREILPLLIPPSHIPPSRPPVQFDYY